MGDFPGEPHTSVIAPNLDRLSREGARFVNAISNYPVCSPYRAMLMSGRAPFMTGVVENRIILREKGESFGDVFRSAGYRTGYIGKWHLGGEDRPRQGMHGFEHFQPLDRYEQPSELQVLGYRRPPLLTRNRIQRDQDDRPGPGVHRQSP